MNSKINLFDYKINDSDTLSKIRRFCQIVHELAPVLNMSDTTRDGIAVHLDDYAIDVSLDLGNYFDKFDPNMIEGFSSSLPDKIMREIKILLETNPHKVFEGLNSHDER